jgi:RNA polymerase sigma factor (TIGR02999 family)
MGMSADLDSGRTVDTNDLAAVPAETEFAEAYEHLRRLARARLRGGGRGGGLDTTALVHEAYLRLTRATTRLEDRARFLRYAGQVMRSIIVDHARSLRTARRGGDVLYVTLGERLSPSAASGEDEIMAVHHALERLATRHPRLAKIVELRYFGGLSDAEIGLALDVTDRTVRRDWEKARLLLAEELR